MVWSILPREEKFFTLFAELAAKVTEGARRLQELVTNYTDVEAKTRAIKEIEHEGDLITHEVLDKLNKSFITPLEREDIRALAQYLDDVLDDIEATADRFLLFGVTRPTSAAIEMVGIIVKATVQIQKAVDSLENLKEIHVFVVEINRLENMADNVCREEIGKLFHHEQDLREVLRWKEIYEQLESCADRCEDVADTIEDIVVKNA
jgi:predicted phosphate transport protein (TIGR00153 family)